MAKRNPSMTGAAVWAGRTVKVEGFSRRWPPHQLEALAVQLEKDTGCTVDREVFRDDMVQIDAFYWTVKLQQQGSTSEAYAAMKRASRRCQEFRSSLQEAIEAAAPLDDLEVMLADIQRMEGAITRQAEFLQQFRPRRSAGRPRAVFFGYMINGLALIFEEHTGRLAGTSSGHGHDDRGGTFVRFAKSVLGVVEPGDRHRALGENAKKILQDRKRNRGLSREYLSWMPTPRGDVPVIVEIAG